MLGSGPSNKATVDREVKAAIRVENDMKKIVQLNAKNGIDDVKLVEQYKKQRNY